MIQISQIHADDIASLHFIERIYTESFPQDERRDFDEVVRLLRENDDFEIVMIADQEKPVGFISYWSWSDFTYMEHFAIDSHCRGAGYGAIAMTTLLQQIGKPAVLEVEKPTDDLSRRRIHFYERLGFTLSTRPYIQPPYSPDRNPLELYLMSYGAIDLDSVFDTVVSRIHSRVYGVK